MTNGTEREQELPSTAAWPLSLICLDMGTRGTELGGRAAYRYTLGPASPIYPRERETFPRY